MARVKLFLAFFALVVFAGGVVAAAYYWEKIARPNWHVTRELESGLSQNRKSGPDLGIREYEAAVDLLKEGELQAASDRLYYLMKYYPESSVYPEAKRIIGEINLDLLISRLPITGKTEHVVKRGDVLNVIARRNECTIDYIMRANGRTTPVIYPNDHLIVFPLKFAAEIDISDKTVTVTREDGTFFKEYPVREFNLPTIIKPPVKTEISEKVAWFDGRSVNFTSKNYLNCSKWIRTKKMGLFIRVAQEETPRDKTEKVAQDPDTGSVSETATYGVMVDRTDIEELFTILRVGSPVTLIE